MPQDFPPEIWLHISSFVSEQELFRLIGVNIHFYNLALDARYSTIRVETVTAYTERLLQRLKDPVVGRRVLRLVIRPALNLRVATPSRPITPSLWQRFTSTTTRKPPVSPSVDRIVDDLILAFPGFTNLTRFEVEAWEMSSDYDLQGFFRSAWSAFGRQLKVISITGRPETFRQFVASNPQPDACTTLGLGFTHELDAMASAAVVAILVDLAPFINSQAAHLQSLNVWSWSTLDISALFTHLGRFPSLKSFHLRAPFNKAFSDPSGLTKLLENNSSSLDNIQLRLTPAGSAMDPSSEQLLGQWLLSHESHPTVLSHLKTLQMYPTSLSSGFDALVMYIRRSADTLTTLVIKDRYLDLSEVKALITPISHRSAEDGLKNLRLNVRVWNADLLNFLALKLPGLRSLSLYVGGSQPATQSFLYGAETQPFMLWKLYDIGAWQGGSELPDSVMRLLASRMKSVQSFWGNGHMLGDSKIYEHTWKASYPHSDITGVPLKL